MDKFYPVVLLGLKPGENMFVNAEGARNASACVPAVFRRYPFGLTRAESCDLMVCLDGAFLIDEKKLNTLSNE